jgi:hypothetical protein
MLKLTKTSFALVAAGLLLVSPAVVVAQGVPVPLGPGIAHDDPISPGMPFDDWNQDLVTGRATQAINNNPYPGQEPSQAQKSAVGQALSIWRQPWDSRDACCEAYEASGAGTCNLQQNDPCRIVRTTTTFTP